MSIPEKELGPWSTSCPRCGNSADVNVSGPDTVDVDCPNCGPFETQWEDFEKVAQSAELDSVA